MSQIKRAELLFKNHLARLGISMEVRSFIVFVNDEFALYNLSRDLKIILPGQIKRFLKSLSRETYSEVSVNKVELLLENQLLKSKYDFNVDLRYEDMTRGVTCGSCNGWMIVKNKTTMICKSCTYEEKVDDAFRRCLEELNILFPNHKITVNSAMDWTDHVFSISKTRRLLNKICTQHGKSRGTHYKLEG